MIYPISSVFSPYFFLFFLENCIFVSFIGGSSYFLVSTSFG